MLKYGVVTAVDTAKARVRVRFPGDDGLVSWWLQVVQHKTGQDRFYALPDPGEHVACLMDDGNENGVVVGAIYSDPEPPPADDADLALMLFKDDARIAYDRAAHELAIELPAAGKIRLKVGRSELVISDGQVTVTTPAFAGVKA